ncbi:MAG: His/Gly/Thr/Pro-type tRNA ligase C-terminal domain-containing protein, partial [Algoriella sp.]
GVPVRIAIGPKDLEKGQVEVARRDTLEKQFISLDNVGTEVAQLLEDIQANLYNRALDYRDTHITEATDFTEFKEILDNKGGFISALWDGTEETEEAVKNATKATIRCIPQAFETPTEGIDIFSGKPAKYRVLYAKAY